MRDAFHEHEVVGGVDVHGSFGGDLNGSDFSFEQLACVEYKGGALPFEQVQ